MTAINIDIISEGASTDKALREFGEKLQGEIPASSVTDMVQIIIRTLGTNKMKRLRIFGHGAPGLVCVGQVPTTLSLDSGADILDRNSLKTIRVIHHKIQQRNGTIRNEYPVLNDRFLRQLQPRFEKGGWAELHACNVAETEHGKMLLTALAQFWGVPVKGATGKQYAGGGLENDVHVAYPDGRYDVRKPAAKSPAGCSVRW